MIKPHDVKSILLERSAFRAINAYQNVVRGCSHRCRNKVKNNSNYPQQVTVCTSQCKVNMITKIIAGLIALKNTATNVDNKSLETKIMHFQSQLQDEQVKLTNAQEVLKARLRTIPVALSTKPSPERYKPGKIQ